MSTTPAGLTRFQRSMTTRYNGKCAFCGLTTMADTDHAARSGDKWIAVCRTCAGSVAAQVKAMVNRLQAAVTASPLAEAQLTAIQTLLPASDALVAAMADDATDAQAVPVLAKLDAAMVALQSLTPAAATVRSNRYSGRCGDCRGNVAEGAGRIEKVGGKWVTFHLAGECSAPAGTPETPAAPAAGVGLYVHDDGTVRRVYETQNGHLGCKVLVAVPNPHHDASDPDSHEFIGSLDYEKGGRAIVSKALAAGTCHLCSQDEARAMGRLYSFCCNCARDLNDDRSVAAGYGPDCAGHNGWYYPTYSEAAAILQRPVVDSKGKVYPPAA